MPAVGGDYEFSVMCPISGIMSGSISFTDSDGFTIWYTMDVEVTAPQAESTIIVESVVRKAVSVEIGLENPLAEDLIFNVNIEGDGVFGDSLLQSTFQRVSWVSPAIRAHVLSSEPR